MGFASKVHIQLALFDKDSDNDNRNEAFTLRAEDIKFVANQFRPLHNMKLQHTFRFYSHQWRKWAACFIQAACPRCKRRKMAKTLSPRESFSYGSDEDENTESDQEQEDPEPPSSNFSHAKQNLGVTILASRFAVSTRRGLKRLRMMVA